jgi:hypothetical protein
LYSYVSVHAIRGELSSVFIDIKKGEAGVELSRQRGIYMIKKTILYKGKV